MLHKFYPDVYISTLENITPEFFIERGINGIILDLDNTIIPWKSDAFEDNMIELVKQYQEKGLKICVLSNALTKRVSRLLKPLGIPGVARARKPRRKAFLKAMNILGTEPKETAVVGDQLFTDIFGGNRLGLFTVLVVPRSKKEFIGTKLVRVAEKILLKRLHEQGTIRD